MENPNLKAPRIAPVLRQGLALFVCLLLVYLAAGLGALASVNAGAFYAELVRPAWAPPGWIFGPVWSLLYTLMAIAAWLVWRVRERNGYHAAITCFLIQLAANALWSWLFFRWHMGMVALVEILLLWGLIVATLISFQRLSKCAAFLLLPYLLWVTFAAFLNYSLLTLNPDLL